MTTVLPSEQFTTSSLSENYSLFDHFFNNYQDITDYETVFNNLWNELSHLPRHTNNTYLDYQHIVSEQVSYLRIIHEHRYRFYFIIYGSNKAMLAFDELSGYFFLQKNTKLVPSLGDANITSFKKIIPLRQFFETDTHWIIVDRVLLESGGTSSNYYFYYFNDNVIEVVKNACYDSCHEIYQVDHKLTKEEFMNVPINGVLIFKADEANQTIWAKQDDKIVIDLSNKNNIFLLENRSYFEKFYKKFDNIDVKFLDCLKDDNFYVTNKYYGSIQQFLSSKQQLIKKFKIGVYWVNIPNIYYIDNGFHQEVISQKLIKDTPHNKIMSIVYSERNFEVTVHTKKRENEIRYFISFKLNGKRIAYFRFVGKNTVNVPPTYYEVNNDAQYTGILSGSYLMHMNLPEIEVFPSFNRVFSIINSWVDPAFTERGISEYDIIHLFKEDPKQLLQHMIDDFTWTLLILVTQNVCSGNMISWDLLKYTTDFKPKHDNQEEEVNEYSASYNEDLQEFNIGFTSLASTGGKGKAKMERSTFTNVGDVPDVNIKIDVNKGKIIMNNDNNSMVEIDVATREVEEIVKGYKYGLFFGPRGSKQVMIELEILPNARTICCPTKNRTDRCKVLSIYDEEGKYYSCAYGKFSSDFLYTVGEEIVVSDFSLQQKVCMNGIHFCHSIDELKKYWSKQ